jgi:AcrR family transcriptional regulator
MPRKNDPAGTVAKIIDVAGELFAEKGYERTTMQDIVDGLGMSKGAIFHHFKSKEDVMDAVIRRMADGIVERARAIADDPTLGVADKLRTALMSMNVSGGVGGEVIAELHKPANARMHQTILVKTTRAVVPVFAEIVEQGIREGIYDTPYPLETLEFLFAASQAIFDSGAFDWSEQEFAARARCFTRIMELSLGATEGSFDFLFDNLSATRQSDPAE